jgi:hypothetical protein
MKKLIALTLAGTMLLGGSMVYAGSACCPAKSKEAKAGKDAYCSDVLSKLNLTDDQKKKVAALREECDKGGCTEAGKGKYYQGLKEILTPEQLTQCKSECEKVNKSACPFMKSDPKS